MASGYSEWQSPRQAQGVSPTRRRVHDLRQQFEPAQQCHDDEEKDQEFSFEDRSSAAGRKYFAHHLEDDDLNYGVSFEDVPMSSPKPGREKEVSASLSGLSYDDTGSIDDSADESSEMQLNDLSFFRDRPQQGWSHREPEARERIPETDDQIQNTWYHACRDKSRDYNILVKETLHLLRQYLDGLETTKVYRVDQLVDLLGHFATMMRYNKEMQRKQEYARDQRQSRQSSYRHNRSL